MPKVLYNEGRTVGLSSWELYLRQVLATNPNADPLDERKWLSASLGAHSSMVLKIAAGTTAGVHDYVLPETSDLFGCTVIQGSIFEGIPSFAEGEYWAQRIDDYGRLISNTNERHPQTPGTPENVPAKVDPVPITPEFADQCREFTKVTGALMFQPGEWTSNIYYTTLLTEGGDIIVTEDDEELLVPVKDFVAVYSINPDFAKAGFIRLAISQDIEHEFYILFSGFSYKTVANGEVSYAQLESKGHPEDGDFLGPATFPWGCKIVLTISNDIMSVINGDVNAKIDNIYVDVQNQLINLGTRMTAIENEFNSLNDRVTAAEGRIDTDEQNISRIDQAVVQLSEDVAEINTSLNDLINNRIPEIDSSITDINLSIESIEGDVATNTSNIETNTSDIAANTETIGQHTTELEDHEERITALENEEP